MSLKMPHSGMETINLAEESLYTHPPGMVSTENTVSREVAWNGYVEENLVTNDSTSLIRGLDDYFMPES